MSFTDHRSVDKSYVFQNLMKLLQAKILKELEERFDDLRATKPEPSEASPQQSKSRIGMTSESKSRKSARRSRKSRNPIHSTKINQSVLPQLLPSPYRK